MKKNFIWVVAGLLGVIIGAGLIFILNSQKVAYINTALLMEKSIEMQRIKAHVKEYVGAAKANVDTLQMEFENKMKDYEKSVSSMSTKEKQMAQELLNMKRQELIRYQQAMEGKLSQDEQKLTAEVLKFINNYITEYGKKHHYKIIFATVNGNIAYAEESIDITEEIIQGVNEKVK